MMKQKAQGFRNLNFKHMLMAAIAGSDDDLFNVLCRFSGLPGEKANLELAKVFGEECALLGEKADPLIEKLLGLNPDEALGGSAREFLPLCGLFAVAERGARDSTVWPWSIKYVHNACDDLRFRVREATVFALKRLGEKDAPKLVDELSQFTNGYFHAASALLALGEGSVFQSIRSPQDLSALLERVSEAFLLFKKAPRSASRYPGYKSLVFALEHVPGKLAEHFGAPVFDLMLLWLNEISREATLISEKNAKITRELVAKNLRSERLRGRYTFELEKMYDALKKTETPRRDPKTFVGPTRGRGKKRWDSGGGR